MYTQYACKNVVDLMRNEAVTTNDTWERKKREKRLFPLNKKKKKNHKNPLLRIRRANGFTFRDDSVA